MAPERDRLLAAAREEFLAHGFKRAGIAAVAERAGMAVGSVYSFFGSKKDLFLEVYAAENEASKAAVVASVGWAEPKPALMAYIAANLAAVRQNAILAEWFGDAVVPVLRERAAAEGTGGAKWDFLVGQFDAWRDEGRLSPVVTVDLVDELFTAANLVDASGSVSLDAQRFMIEAVLDRLFTP